MTSTNSCVRGAARFLPACVLFACLLIPRSSSAQGAEAQTYDAPAEVRDPELQVLLDELVHEFRGKVGVYVHHLSSGRTAGINADTIFPTASMVKVPILVKTFDLIDRGILSYDSLLVYRDSLLYEGDDILGLSRMEKPSR